MKELLLMLVGSVIVLLIEYAGFKPWSKRRHRFNRHESAVLQSIAFLECERIGHGAEATLRLGNDTFEDWEHLAAFETLLAEGYIEKQSEPTKYGLSAHGQLVAMRLFEQGAPTPYTISGCVANERFADEAYQTR